MRTTVYIPCYNGAAYLGATLESLAAQTRPPDEVLVIDDGSRDETAAVAGSFGAKVLQHHENKGLAAARNTALGASTGDLLIGLDVDAVPDATYVERLAETFEARPDLDAACGRLIEAHSVLLPDRWRQVHMAQHHGEEPLDDPRILFGSVTAVRTAAARALGGWNPQFRTNYEDVDFTERLKAAGARTAYIPAAIARHARTDDLCSLLDAFWRWYRPAGLVRGHFDGWEPLIRHRIGPVNWGIFAYRLARDLNEHRSYLSGITAIVPWWLCLEDAIFLGRRLPDLREAGLAAAGAIPAVARECLLWAGASEYVAGQVEQRLRWRVEAVGPGGRVGGPLGGAAEYVAAVREAAQRHLPEDRLIWAKVEHSLARLEYEEHLERRWTDDFSVMLVNAPWYTPTRQGVRAGSRWPFTLDRRDASPIPRYVPFPFFLAQTAEVLSVHRRRNAIVDAIAEGLTYEEFFERVRGAAPDLIIAETSAASFENDCAQWERLRQALPGVRIYLAGPHATARWRQILETVPAVEGVLIGEYEMTALRVVEALSSERLPAGIPGVAVRTPEGIIGGQRPEPVPFEKVGRPDRLRLPLYNYRDGFGDLPEPVAQLMATRGCPYECIFCQWPQVYYERRTIQRRDPDALFEEVRELVERFGFPAIYFDDDMFSPGKTWLARFLGRIRQSGMTFAWSIMSRADTFSEAQWREMAACGLRAVKFGVESGDQQMVDRMGKRLDLDTLRRTVRICRQAGISVHLTFTVGLPGENEQTLRATRDLIMELLPDSLQISRAVPLPGTAFEEWAFRTGARRADTLVDLDGFLAPPVRLPDLAPEQIDAFIGETYAEYRRRRDARAAQAQSAADVPGPSPAAT